MKLRMLTLGAALLLAGTVFGQEQQTSTEPDLKTKFGIKGSFSLTTLYSSDVSTNHMKPGFDAGIFVKMPVTRGFSIQPELLYSLQGAKNTYSNFVEGNGEYRFNLGYLKVPVLAVVNIAPNFNLHLGGYAAYLVNANIKQVDNNGTLQSATELNTSDFQRWDAGLIGGAAFDIENVTIGARYNYGLVGIGKDGSVSGDITKGQKNAGFNFYLGFGF
jgi:hypothetical protein